MKISFSWRRISKSFSSRSGRISPPHTVYPAAFDIDQKAIPR
jgi:hypothetical protein